MLGQPRIASILPVSHASLIIVPILWHFVASVPTRRVKVFFDACVQKSFTPLLLLEVEEPAAACSSSAAKVDPVRKPHIEARQELGCYSS